MFYSVGGTEIFKLLAYKLCSVVRYQSVGYAKMHYYAMQEFDYVFLSDTSDRLCLDPFGKSIDGNKQELVSSLGLWKWS